jgi:hypothetical protein
MTGARELLTSLTLVGALGAGCAEAPAQEAKRIEHGVLEYTKLHLARGDQEKARWATAGREIEVESIPALWAELGIEAQAQAPEADRVRVLDHLAGKGWEVVDRTDVAAVLAGATGISQRYLLRRRK